MPDAGWSGLKHTATQLWSSENVFCGVMNHTSVSGILINDPGFGKCQENVACHTTLCQLCCWRRDNAMGLFFWCWPGSHPLVMENLNASVYQDNLGNSMPPTLWEQFGEGVQTKVYKDMDG